MPSLKFFRAERIESRPQDSLREEVALLQKASLGGAVDIGERLFSFIDPFVYDY